jgi:hypothetical protein
MMLYSTTCIGFKVLGCNPHTFTLSACIFATARATHQARSIYPYLSSYFPSEPSLQSHHVAKFEHTEWLELPKARAHMRQLDRLAGRQAAMQSSANGYWPENLFGGLCQPQAIKVGHRLQGVVHFCAAGRCRNVCVVSCLRGRRCCSCWQC